MLSQLAIFIHCPHLHSSPYSNTHATDRSSQGFAMMSTNSISMKGGKKQSRRGEHKQEFKVKYISSPMKFQASASEFRALVQELTGQDSDAERFVELNSSVQEVQKSSIPTQQWKINGVDMRTSTATEIPAFSYPYNNYSYCLQQGSDQSSLFDDMGGRGFDFDMLSFDSLQSM